MVNNPSNSRLEITATGSVGKFFGKMLNFQEVEIGNPPDFAMQVLGAVRMQMEIMAIPDVFRIKLEGSSLKYFKWDFEANAYYLIKLFNILSDLADQLERN